MLNLFIVLKGLLSPKIALPEFSGLFYFKTKADKRKLPDWVSRCSLIGHSPAFSLVEMLMALLVASLLLAALAPVMTRRMADHELKVMSEASNYDKDSIITIFNDSSETQEFNIPNDTNRITVTMMGGGGAGGDALYGNKEFTSNSTFTVPKDVTKLRVFMIGGGGGGASGDAGTGTAYADTPSASVGTAYTDFLNEGEHKYRVTTNAKAPNLDAKCTKSGISKWTFADDETLTINSGDYIPATNGETVTLKVTACGGGGGGGGNNSNYNNAQRGGGGGSGGYLTDRIVTAAVAPLYIKVGGGGGGAGLMTSGRNGGYGAGGGGGAAYKNSYPVSSGGTYGGRGGAGMYTSASYTANDYYGLDGTGTVLSGYGGTAYVTTAGGFSSGRGGRGAIWGGGGGGGGRNIMTNTDIAGGGGGGGGGPTTISTALGTAGTILFQVGGGGGGASSTYARASNGLSGGSGGGGGGYGGGGGGGGAGGTAGSGGAGGAANTTVIGGGTGLSGSTGGAYYGGNGGGGYGGASGKSGSSGGAGGTISSIFGANYCNGGEAGPGDVAATGTSGKPGALRLFQAGTNGKTNTLKCSYSNLPVSGGGGGGAGQMWIGEIDVTPNQVISLNIGQGGAVQSNRGLNGNDGTSTSIVVGSNTYSVSGGKGGKYEEDSTYISNSGGLGGGLKTTNFSSSARYDNWTGINFNGGGKNGSQGNTTVNGSGGGAGGASYKVDGTVLNGGNGGGTQTNGINALAENYGAGGGGGGGSSSTESFGTGGKGANGYIYIEWGGTNGSGGTGGEITQKVLTNFDGNDRKMMINIGKGGRSSINNGKGEDTTIVVKSGGKNVTLTARGGIKGNNGTSETNIHGDTVNYPDNYNELYKEFVQSNLSIISGQKGEDEYGGMGGYLACLYNTQDEEGNKVCTPVIKSNDGTDISAGPVRPGCGGSSITAPLYESICLPYSTTANPNGGNGTFGGGGGGGAVLNRTQGIGGNGGDGFVILEYKSTM